MGVPARHALIDLAGTFDKRHMVRPNETVARVSHLGAASEVRRYQLFIDGTWAPPESDASLTVVSPHSETIIGRAACAGPAKCEAKRC